MDDRRVQKLTHLFSFNQQIHQDVSDYFLCNTCKIVIKDEFYLRAGSRIYHESCLQCAVCQIILNEQTTCFLKGVDILCRQDYYKSFANKCSICGRLIHPNDWIRRACDCVYHLTCFGCYICQRQLSTGEEYALENGHILCKIHFIDGNEDKDEDNKQNKTKRMRTAFNEEQLQILQANFEIDQNPDGQELEHMSQRIGLSKRVIQVWFQNTRARQKKQKPTSRKRNISNSSNSSNSSVSDDILLKQTTQNWYQGVQTLMKTKTRLASISNVNLDEHQTNYNYNCAQ